MADVVAIDSCVRLMLLPYYDDVVWLVLLPEWLMLLPHNCSSYVAGVIAMVVDGKSTRGCGGRCYSKAGRWNSHWVNVLILILMFCVGPHPICEAHGTCLCSCLGIDRGLSERTKRTCNKFGVLVYFKGGQTIKSLLMAPKDKDPVTTKSGVIYRYKCSEHGCKEEYIGESARNYAERFKEHQKVPSPIFDHCNTTGHNININNFTIVGREQPEPNKSNQRGSIHKCQ